MSEGDLNHGFRGMLLGDHQEFLGGNGNLLLPSLFVFIAVNAPVLIRMMGSFHASAVDDVLT